MQAAAPMVAWSMAGVWQHGGLLCALLGGQAGPTACVVGDATSCATSCAVLPGSGRLPLLQPGMAMHVRAQPGMAMHWASAILCCWASCSAAAATWADDASR